MSYQYKITVFTPTYNRAYIIENLYNSLRRQTYRNFEWLVIDDGSSDNTGELFARWCQEDHVFPIRYVRQENAGKCAAINHGLALAEGELFFTMDSDDFLTDDALEKLVLWERALPQNQRYCGFAGMLSTTAGQVSGRIFEEGFFDGTALDRYSAVDGERAMVFYTDIHRKYLYPVFPDEKFMTEAVAWNRMAHDGYKMRFYNDVIWIYEYMPDGLTSKITKLHHDNPKGFGLCIREKAEFQGLTGFAKFMVFYSFCCELKDLYTPAQIAGFLGISPTFCRLILLIHRLKNIGGKK